MAASERSTRALLQPSGKTGSKYRTIMDRFHDEIVCEEVIARNRDGVWWLYGFVDHSYRKVPVATSLYCKNIKPENIKLIIGWLCVDQAFIKLIDDAGIAHET